MHSIFDITIDISTIPLSDSGVNELQKLTKQYTNTSAPKNKSNSGGYQSDNINPQSLDEKYVHTRTLLKQIETNAINYANKLGLGPLHNDGKTALSLKDFWINVNPKGSYNLSHMHPGCLLSGVYYVNVNEDTGNLLLSHPCNYIEYDWNERTIHQPSKYNGSLYVHKPSRNELVLFPSWLSHSVEVNNSELHRISISFNLA